MLKHIVMWQFKDEVDGKSKDEICQTVKEMLDALPAKIPLIKSLEVGINAFPSEGAADMVLITEFNSNRDLEAYTVHPDHVLVGEVIAKVRLTRTAVDYLI
ncbi:MAG TPA: Dabb family protein [Treponema sp.]|nr:Dabb family protein [Treponema sp.]